LAANPRIAPHEREGGRRRISTRIPILSPPATATHAVAGVSDDLMIASIFGGSTG
jgi:hypothetical protein